MRQFNQKQHLNKFIVRNSKNGKISLSQSYNTCERCKQYSHELLVLRKQILNLRGQLRQREDMIQKMNILCQEIHQTKQKLINKVNSKYHNFEQIIAQNKRRQQFTSRKMNYDKDSSYFTNGRSSFKTVLMHDS